MLGQGSAGDYDYASTVQYPFGFGLSLTTFDWSGYQVKWGGDTCEVSLTVKNSGDVAGKEVVQVYLQSPYTDYDRANAVEKSAVELVGYAKTGLLQPGDSETVTVTFDKEQLKAYDYTNAKTYILDAGDYYITAASDAHQAINNILAAKGKTMADGMTENGNVAVSLHVSGPGPDGVPAVTVGIFCALIDRIPISVRPSVAPGVVVAHYIKGLPPRFTFRPGLRVKPTNEPI